MTATVHQLLPAQPPLELVWDDRWDHPPAEPTHRRRVWETGAVLHQSTDFDDTTVRVSVGTAPGAVMVVIDGGRFDTATPAGRAAVSDLAASLTAALNAGRDCEGCGAEAGEQCFPGCLSHEEG